MNLSSQNQEITKYLEMDETDLSTIKSFTFKKVAYAGKHPEVENYLIAELSFNFSVSISEEVVPVATKTQVFALFLHHIPFEVGQEIPVEYVVTNGAIL